MRTKESKDMAEENISFDYSNAMFMVSDEDIAAMRPRVEEAKKTLLERTGEGNDSIKQMLWEYSFIDLPTRGGASECAIDRYNDLRDLLFEEIVNYFYDTVDGFDIDY